jgi:hypothetical protein
MEPRLRPAFFRIHFAMAASTDSSFSTSSAPPALVTDLLPTVPEKYPPRRASGNAGTGPRRAPFLSGLAFPVGLMLLSLGVMAGWAVSSFTTLRQRVQMAEADVASVRAQLADLKGSIGKPSAESPPAGAPASTSLLSPEARAALDRLTTRAELGFWADEAVTQGLRSSYQSLDRALAQGTDTLTKTAAEAELLRVDGFYAMAKQLPPPALTGTAPAPDVLVTQLMDTSTPWIQRVTAAQHLAVSPTFSGVQTLGAALVAEPHLMGLLHLTETFNQLTHCPLPDLFGGTAHLKWLQENEATVRAALLTTGSSSDPEPGIGPVK